MRDGPRVEAGLIFALREKLDIDGIPVHGRRHGHEFQKTAQSDGQLPVEWVGMGQLLLGVEM